MAVEGGQVTGVGIDRSTGNGRNRLGLGGRRQPSIGGTSRISREAYVRFCERLCQEDVKASCCTKDGGGPFGAAL
jgi:hypothetical protein